MLLISIINDLGKAFGIVVLFFALSGAYFLLKTTEESKYLDQQLKMYPLGFHCNDEKDETVVMKFDMKSQLALSTDNEVHKYTMKNALYREGEKKPFGCELAFDQNGDQRNLLVYVDDGNVTDLKDVRYEPSEDKDLIYKVVEKSVKKKLDNIRIQF